MIAELTAAHFEPLRDQAFTLTSVEPPLSLRLIEVQRTGKGERAGGAFSLLWQSGDGAVLPQGIYAISNDALGEIELFIVPVGRADGGIQYQAVFT
ncbi:hypothetical protein [Hoeflea sp. BAL378]|uniref:DUF6916 family protein n=1 Tax=Hoeflea sp. BAL378 TaxID=1547437 RepID=UPI000690F89E|nr:hypothetical protein [Hoeflea sp. BAL378]